eukprot:393680_1
MATLESWSTDDVITWIQTNLPTQYHVCIVAIQEHDIDGKLLKECLINQDAKSSLLQMLFPDSQKDAFLRLSFMRKLEKYETKSPPNNTTHDAAQPATQPSNICIHCGVEISPLLIENHQRHCFKQQAQAQPSTLQSDPQEEDEERKQIEQN